MHRWRQIFWVGGRERQQRKAGRPRQARPTVVLLIVVQVGMVAAAEDVADVADVVAAVGAQCSAGLRKNAPTHLKW